MTACLSGLQQANVFLTGNDRVKHHHSNHILTDKQATRDPKLEPHTIAAVGPFYQELQALKLLLIIVSMLGKIKVGLEGSN